MRRNLLLFAAITLLALPAPSFADTFTFSPTPTAANTNTSTNNPSNSAYQGGANQFDLDHHLAYTWQIGNINIPQGQVITSARITLRNIANWDTNANMLFVHLLDTARTFSTAITNRSATVNGVTSFVDASGTPVTNISDYFAGDDSALVANGTGDTFLFSQSFAMVGQVVNQVPYVATDFTYNFTAAQLTALASYIANGNNLALGFDPDCHYWNNGLSLTIITVATPTPEPASLLLLGTGIVGSASYLRRRSIKKSL